MDNTAERVGPAFSVDGMLRARVETRKAIAAIAARIRPGMAEEDAVAMARDVIATQGHALSWHPVRVRFGANTILPMKRASTPGVVLGEHDIFFIRHRAARGALGGRRRCHVHGGRRAWLCALRRGRRTAVP